MEPNGFGILPATNFPGTIEILDLFHARQHLWELARKRHPTDEAEQRRWMMVQQDLLGVGP
jgi:hypothetical protein